MQDTREARDSSLNKIAGNPNAPERKPRKHPRQLTLVEKRSLEASVSIATETLEQLAFQHTVLCQTCMPYRNPGDEIRVWDREQGDIALRIEAGVARHPETNRWVELGLPFGPKARLILAHLNAEALRIGSPEIEVERSLTAAGNSSAAACNTPGHESSSMARRNPCKYHSALLRRSPSRERQRRMNSTRDVTP